MPTLLEPISEAAPCGVDLSSDPVYNDLAVLMEGTPENQFEPGSAKEPNWPAIVKLSEESLKRSKDLQIAVYYTVALTQTTGVAGAARGLDWIATTVRSYWASLFPNLDPDDPDPTQRVNILSQLTVEPGSYGDPIKFIDRLNAAPIFRVPGLAVTMAYLVGGTAAPGPKLPEIMAAGNAEEVQAGVAELRRIAATVHSLDDYLIQTLGRGATPSFDPLIKAIDKGLRVFDELAGAASGEDTAANTAGAGRAAVAAGGAVGEIASPDDVRRVLKKICAYYAANEPSSPVPLLLERAERLVGRNFLDLLSNLTPSAHSEIVVIMGPTEAEEAAAKNA